MNPIIDSMFVFIAFLLIVVFISSLSLIIGLINPKILNKLFKTKKFNRKNIFISWITIILISIILGFIGTTIDENLLDKQVEKFKKGELTSISPKVAQKYITKYCYIADCLDTQNSPSNKLTSVTPEVLDIFYSSNNVMVSGISLNGLTNLQLEIAKKLQGRDISLNGLNTISFDVAAELINSGSMYLNLKGINSVSPDVAKELSKYKGIIIGSDYLMKELNKYNCSPSEELIKAFQ
jgi:hypothetical protein